MFLSGTRTRECASTDWTGNFRHPRSATADDLGSVSPSLKSFTNHINRLYSPDNAINDRSTIYARRCLQRKQAEAEVSQVPAIGVARRARGWQEHRQPALSRLERGSMVAEVIPEATVDLWDHTTTV